MTPALLAQAVAAAVGFGLAAMGARALYPLVTPAFPADLPADWPQRGALGISLCALAGLALAGAVQP